jgi:hypothetical protein
MATERSTLRAAATGWGAEDSALVRPGHIGNTPGPRWRYRYETPMHALRDGWKLLAPAQLLKGEGDSPDEWEWWFVRDDEPGSVIS